jgi:hypothetical protein
MEPRSTPEHASLWFGPGARLEELAALLQTLGVEAGGTLAEAGDLGELQGSSARLSVRLLWDVDTLAQEDLGFLRRHISRAGGEVVIVGDDPSRRAVRSLLRHANVSYLPWPPDIEDLRALAGGSQRGSPAAQPAAVRPRPQPDEELAEIEDILSGAEPPRGAALRPERALEEQAPPAAAPAAPSARLEPPPAYFKDQVADLADIAQRIQLSLEAAGDGKRGEVLERVGPEVERLLQFTRTLGFLVAPPAPGAQEFDLSEMVEVFLAGTPKTADSPRLLFRGGGELPVRSDRALLAQAFDAFVFLAQNCAGKGEIVRLQTRAEGDLCALSIQFPAGPLAELEPERILQPYGLRRAVPKLGPNALAAATGIVAGQGGRALLERVGHGRLGWRIELPRAAGRG